MPLHPKKHIAPSLAFFLRVRRDTESFPPALQRFIKEEVPVNSLREGGMEPEEVETIVLSHLYYDHVPTGRTRVLPLTDFTHTLASFPHAHDFFNDGSLYVINSPGHVVGHISLLARTSDDGAWIYLSGDTYHDPRLLSGEREIAFEVDHNGCLLKCAHTDKEAAAEHIRRVKVLSDMQRVHVLMAHDWEWYERNGGFEGGAGGVFLPGKIPAIGA
ncbi:hypothetical protein K439DRAFT_1628007 [Ramaria rubella]|nr:hypothetical protein K439DRAFT_1628007 [Ramaria rubella]